MVPKPQPEDLPNHHLGPPNANPIPKDLVSMRANCAIVAAPTLSQFLGGFEQDEDFAHRRRCAY